MTTPREDTVASLARETGATVLRVSRHVDRIAGVQGASFTVAGLRARSGDRVLTAATATAIRNTYRDGDFT